MKVEFLAEPRPSAPGAVEWRGVKLVVPEGVYEPREDSFLLAEAVEEFAEGSVLDMGTGCGIQGIIAAGKTSVGKVLACDVSEKALAAARLNAEANGVAGKISFVKTNLFSAVKNEFDTIAFNPPYLPTEPGGKKFPDAVAWDGGRGGRKVVDRFLEEFQSHLAPGGKLLLLSSSLSGTRETLERLGAAGYGTEIVGEKSFFFEKITVIKAERETGRGIL